MVAAAGAFALGIFSVALIYNTLGTSEKSIANNRYNGMETLAEFQFRKTVLINETALPEENLADFPLMISIKDDDLRSIKHGGKVISDQGYDIRFTKSDGVSLLDYEIESYNPESGNLVCWVRIDSLSKGINNQLFLYFNNKFAANESSSATWNKTYRGVWHLKGALSSKIPHANQVAHVEKRKSDDEKEVYVASEKNSSQFVCLNTPEDVDIAGDITVSAWVYLTAGKKEQSIVNKLSNYNGGYRLFVNKKNRLAFEIRNANSQVAQISQEIGIELETNKWIHVAAKFSEGSDEISTFVNGVMDATAKAGISLEGSTEPLQIGRDPQRKQFYFAGLVDEVRISNKALTNNWIAAEYANQSVGSNFVTFSATEPIQQQISMSLLTFDAEVAGNAVALKWLTATEIENELFTVERSKNGLEFAQIGTLPGAGNSNELLTYNYKDKNLEPGTFYYRVKMTNAAGGNEYSMITPINIEAEEEANIRLMSPQPNPFKEDFSVEYIAPKEGEVKVKLQSLQGEVILEETYPAVKASLQKFYYKDENKLRPGVYFLSVSQDDEKKMVKLVKRM
jgi:hypothetical protein